MTGFGELSRADGALDERACWWCVSLTHEHFLSSSFIFGGAGDQTQDLTHANQALHH